MTGSRFDVSVIWKRPYWPGSAAIIALDLCLLPFREQGGIGIALQDLGFGIAVLWLVFVLFFAEPRRRKRGIRDSQ